MDPPREMTHLSVGQFDPEITQGGSGFTEGRAEGEAEVEIQGALEVLSAINVFIAGRHAKNGLISIEGLETAVIQAAIRPVTARVRGSPLRRSSRRTEPLPLALGPRCSGCHRGSQAGSMGYTLSWRGWGQARRVIIGDRFELFRTAHRLSRRVSPTQPQPSLSPRDTAPNSQ